MSAMTTPEWELREAVIRHQRITAPLGQLFEELYRCQEALAEVLMDAPLPIIGLCRGGSGWRGRYLSVSPLGLRYYTELNADAFKTADQCLMTLAHELAHWHRDVLGGTNDHGREWQNDMERMGITTNEYGNVAHINNQWDVFETEHAGDLVHILLS